MTRQVLPSEVTLFSRVFRALGHTCLSGGALGCRRTVDGDGRPSGHDPDTRKGLGTGPRCGTDGVGCEEYRERDLREGLRRDEAGVGREGVRAELAKVVLRRGTSGRVDSPRWDRSARRTSK